MRPVALSDEIAVGEMPSADEIAILSRAGFRSLLNVQPDGEVERLLSAADVAAGAAAAGMKSAHVPVASRRLPDATVAAFAQAMAALPRPIYACCYSGARAAAAWALAVAPSMVPAEIARTCTAAGFDMSALVPELELRHRRGTASGTSALPTISTAVAEQKVPTEVTVPVSAGIPTPLAAAVAAPTPEAVATTTAAAAIVAAEKIIFPRAAGAGGFSTAG